MAPEPVEPVDDSVTNVDPAPATESTEPVALANTGPNAVALALASAALVLVGLGLVAATRRTGRFLSN